MVTSGGRLISNGTMRIEGNIVKHEGSNDLLLLKLSLPSTLHYSFTDHTLDEEGFHSIPTELPYYVCMEYCYSSLDSAHIFSCFAIDAEMGYFIAQWKNLPGQFLIASRDGEADPALIRAHFQGFLDLFVKDK
jgi:hypothetical protein